MTSSLLSLSFSLPIPSSSTSPTSFIASCTVGFEKECEQELRLRLLRFTLLFSLHGILAFSTESHPKEFSTLFSTFSISLLSSAAIPNFKIYSDRQKENQFHSHEISLSSSLSSSSSFLPSPSPSLLPFPFPSLSPLPLPPSSLSLPLLDPQSTENMAKLIQRIHKKSPQDTFILNLFEIYTENGYPFDCESDVYSSIPYDILYHSVLNSPYHKLFPWPMSLCSPSFPLHGTSCTPLSSSIPLFPTIPLISTLLSKYNSHQLSSFQSSLSLFVSSASSSIISSLQYYNHYKYPSMSAESDHKRPMTFRVSCERTFAEFPPSKHGHPMCHPEIAALIGGEIFHVINGKNEIIPQDNPNLPRYTVNLKEYDIEFTIYVMDQNILLGIKLFDMGEREYNTKWMEEIRKQMKIVREMEAKSQTPDDSPLVSSSSSPPFLSPSSSVSSPSPYVPPTILSSPTAFSLSLLLLSLPFSPSSSITICDPFVGVGTTLIECALHAPKGREYHYVGYDIEKGAVELGIRRVREMKGEWEINDDNLSPFPPHIIFNVCDIRDLSSLTPPSSLTHILSDLPFGHRCLTLSLLPPIYDSFLLFALHALVRGGWCVAMTAAGGVMQEQWRRVRKRKIEEWEEKEKGIEMKDIADGMDMMDILDQRVVEIGGMCTMVFVMKKVFWTKERWADERKQIQREEMEEKKRREEKKKEKERLKEMAKAKEKEKKKVKKNQNERKLNENPSNVMHEKEKEIGDNKL